MTHIKSETAYKAAMDRIEELLPLVQEDTPPYDRNLIELDLLSGLVEEYEEEHYPIKTPTLIEAIKLRMYEMGLNQTKLSELLGVSTSRVSDYLNGRCEPTLKVAREISRKLNIDGCGYRPRSINPCRAFADSISLVTREKYPFTVCN